MANIIVKYGVFVCKCLLKHIKNRTRRFKANGWIRVGFTKEIMKITKNMFGYESLFITLKGMQLLINTT
jgi:hypothetical protein